MVTQYHNETYRPAGKYCVVRVNSKVKFQDITVNYYLNSLKRLSGDYGNQYQKFH